MKVTHIQHSGFSVELEHHVFIFDFCGGRLPQFPAGKKLCVFVSHQHKDHYSELIWRLKEQYSDVTYVLSDDIDGRRNSRVHYMGPHERKEIGLVLVETLKSTDEGVAFFVQAEGKTIYHAGDLNDWYWENETDEWNQSQKKEFEQEIERLKKYHLDVACLTLDPRQEKNAVLGFLYCLQNLDIAHVFPMHYWKELEEAQAYLQQKELADYAEKIHFDDIMEC